MKRIICICMVAWAVGLLSGCSKNEEEPLVEETQTSNTVNTPDSQEERESTDVPDTPDIPDTPDTPDKPEGPDTSAPLAPFPPGSDKADFNSFNMGKSSTHYATYTNATGWRIENSSLLMGGEENTPPVLHFIDTGMLAPTLNGKVGQAGKLTSPVITGGIGTLTFNYGLGYADEQFRLTIKILQEGKVVKERVLEKRGLKKEVAYGYSWEVNLVGDFTLVMENGCLSGTIAGHGDRLSIWNFDWTELPE